MQDESQKVNRNPPEGEAPGTGATQSTESIQQRLKRLSQLGSSTGASFAKGTGLGPISVIPLAKPPKDSSED